MSTGVDPIPLFTVIGLPSLSLLIGSVPILSTSDAMAKRKELEMPKLLQQIDWYIKLTQNDQFLDL